MPIVSVLGLLALFAAGQFVGAAMIKTGGLKMSLAVVALEAVAMLVMIALLPR